MSSAFDARRKAQEERFFKLEQEREFHAYTKKLKASGRFDSIPTRSASSLVSAGTLPQVMAHQLRLAVPPSEQAARVDTRTVDRSFMQRTHAPGMVSGGLGSSRMSLGASKWAGAEGVTIFNVNKATALMSEQPEHLKNGAGEALECRIAKHLVDTNFVEIGGKKIKLMPDPTPGRAFAWGGTLAIWATAAITVGACRALDIKTMDDMKRVMRAKLSPLAVSIKQTVGPLREWFAAPPMPAGATMNYAAAADGDRGRVDTSNTSFAKGIRRTLR